MGAALADVRLYIGLITYCGYIMYDTDVILTEATRGNFDYIGAAMQLYLDFIVIFIRICILLLKVTAAAQKKNKSR